MNAIETNGLSKSFHNMYAVQNLDLKVPEGSIYGFIGENGSGKSTTEKLICGLLVPSAGDIQLFGKAHLVSWRDRELVITDVIASAIPLTREENIELYEKLCCIQKEIQNEIVSVLRVHDSFEFAG